MADEETAVDPSFVDQMQDAIGQTEVPTSRVPTPSTTPAAPSIEPPAAPAAPAPRPAMTPLPMAIPSRHAEEIRRFQENLQPAQTMDDIQGTTTLEEDWYTRRELERHRRQILLETQNNAREARDPTLTDAVIRDAVADANRPLSADELRAFAYQQQKQAFETQLRDAREEMLRTRSYFRVFLENAAEVPEALAGGALDFLDAQTALIDLHNRHAVPNAALLGADVDALLGEQGPDADLTTDLGSRVETDTITGNLVRALTQFSLGWWAGGYITGAAKNAPGFVGGAQTIFHNAGRGMIADALAFEGAEANLADILVEYTGLSKEDVLGLASEEDDGEMIGRLKGALAAAPAGVFFDAVLAGFKALRPISRLRQWMQDEPQTAQKAIRDYVRSQREHTFTQAEESIYNLLGRPDLRAGPQDRGMLLGDIKVTEDGQFTSFNTRGGYASKRADRGRVFADDMSYGFETRFPGPEELPPDHSRVYLADADVSRQEAYAGPVEPFAPHFDISRKENNIIDLSADGSVWDENAVGTWMLRKVLEADEQQFVDFAERLVKRSHGGAPPSKDELKAVWAAWKAGRKFGVDEPELPEDDPLRMFEFSSASEFFDHYGKVGLFDDLENFWYRDEDYFAFTDRFREVMKDQGIDGISYTTPHQADAANATPAAAVRLWDPAKHVGVEWKNPDLDIWSRYGVVAKGLTDEEMVRAAQGLTEVDYLGSTAHINWGRLTSEESVRTVIAQMIDAYEPSAASMTQTHEETIRQAGFQDAWATLLEARTRIPNEAETYALRTLWKASGEHVAELARQVVMANDPDLLAPKIYAMRHMMAIHQQIQHVVMGIRRQHGRALNQWRIDVGETNEKRLETIRKLIEQDGGTDGNKKLAEELMRAFEGATAGDPLAGQKFGAITEKSHRSWDRAISEFYKNVLLSPPSHVVNFGSNISILLAAPVSRTAAAGMDALFRPDATDRVLFGESVAMLQGNVDAIWDGMRAAAKSFKTEKGGYWRNVEADTPIPDLGASEKYDMFNTPQIHSDAQTLWGAGVRAAGRVIRLNTTSMMAADEFFKTITKRGEIYAQAYQIAQMELRRGRITQAQYNARVAQLKVDPTREMEKIADDMAQYRTFTDQPTFIAQKVNQFKAQNGLARLLGDSVIPFVSTPSKVLAHTFDHLPGLNLLTKRYRDALKAGGRQAAIANGQLVFGTTLAAIVFNMTLEPEGDAVITGSGPPRGSKNRKWWERNYQEDSFRTGDMWYQYSRLDPMGNIIGFAANLAEVARNTGVTDNEATREFAEAFAALALSAASRMNEKGFVEHAVNVIGAIGRGADGKTPDYQLTQALQALAPAMPPMIAQVSRSIDPVMRDANSLMDRYRRSFDRDALMGRLGGARDQYGREKTWAAGLPSWTIPTLPLRTKSVNAMTELDLAQAQDNWFLPPVSTSVNFEGTPVNIRREVNGAYSDYLYLVWQDRPAAYLTKDVPQTVKDEAETLLGKYGDRTLFEVTALVVSGEPVSGPRAAEISYLQKLYAEGTGTQDGTKMDVIESIRKDYYPMAKANLLRIYPDIHGLVREKGARKDFRTEHGRNPEDPVPGLTPEPELQ